MKPIKGYHCAYKIHYHLVFPVKYRKALLSEPIVATLQMITKEIEERYLLSMERMGADINHEVENSGQMATISPQLAKEEIGL